MVGYTPNDLIHSISSALRSRCLSFNLPPQRERNRGTDDGKYEYSLNELRFAEECQAKQ
jgi:hypothetical protein